MGTLITTKGQVTIPLAIRRAADIAVGAELEWRYDPATRAVIATVAGTERPEAGGRFARALGLVRSGMSTDEILAMTRGDEPA